MQLTILLALLGMLVLAWGAAIFLGARNAARSSASTQSSVNRVDELRRAATGLSRDFVAMETSRRAYLLTGEEASREAGQRAKVRAHEGFKRVGALSRRWRNLPPLVARVAAEYRAWVRTGQAELKARHRGVRAAAEVAARGDADRHFRKLWALQAELEDQLAQSQYSYARNQDRTYAAAQSPAVRTALMMLAALVLLAVWLRRAVGAPADALRSASGRLAGGDLETPVTLSVDNELGAVASDLETMRRRLAGRMEALERLRHLSAQVVGATSLQRLADVVLAGLRPEVGRPGPSSGPPARAATWSCGPSPASPTTGWPTTSSRPTPTSATSCPWTASAPARSLAWPTWARSPSPPPCASWWSGWGSGPWPWSRCCPVDGPSACWPCAGPSATSSTGSRRPCSGWPATRSQGRWRRPCGWRRLSGRPAKPGRCSTRSPTECCSPTRSGGSRPGTGPLRRSPAGPRPRPWAAPNGEVLPIAIDKVGRSDDLVSRYGRKVPVAVSSAPIFDIRGRVVGGVDVIRDVSREREIDEVKSALISTVSHELRTPLTLIHGFAELLVLRDMPAERQRSSAVEILDASRRLARLIDDLLSVSRMESGRLVLDPRPLDLSSVVERILSPFRAMAAKHTLRAKLPAYLPVVWGDPDKVEQILTNLVGNAIKYSPGGGEVLVTVDQDGDTVQVSVRDQGIGMSPRDMGQLFEKFYRVDREEVRRAGGTGLGLYITKRLVEMHGGRLWAESWPGVGSVFRFTLPTTSDELAGSGR